MTEQMTKTGHNDATVHGDTGAAAQERQLRKRALKGGVISYANGAISVDCVIRDLAEGGAKIRLQNDLMVPNSFQLQIPCDGISVACIVRWRGAQEMGVEFVSPLVIKDNLKRQVISSGETKGPNSSSLRRS